MSNRMACMLWMLWAAASIDCRQWADFSGDSASNSIASANTRWAVVAAEQLAETCRDVARRRKPRIASTAGERIPAGEPRHRAVAVVARGSPISRSARAASSQAARSVLSRRKWRADPYPVDQQERCLTARSVLVIAAAAAATAWRASSEPILRRAKGCIAPVENLGQIRVFPAETASRFPNELEIDVPRFSPQRTRGSAANGRVAL